MHKRLLTATLGLDGCVALVFGVLSGLRPVAIYGSIVQLEPLALHEGTLAALTSLSIFYVLLGAVCWVTIWTPLPQRLALATILALRHVATGIKAFAEAGALWQVGDPLPDLVIHALFAAAYVALITLGWRAWTRDRGRAG